MSLTITKEIDTNKYDIGVLVMRVQVHKLSEAHLELINIVFKNHKKVIIFLGVPVIGNTKENPLCFASRRLMLLAKYPLAVVLPLKDKRCDDRWSKELDSQIKNPFGDLSALLYGSRDSFKQFYSGKYKVIELDTTYTCSGTEIRKEVSKEILASEDFRAGVIHATYASRSVTYPTVDVVAYNYKGQILLGKKPNEVKYRFIGGFVDRDDLSWENAAKREFSEETGNCEIGDLTYIASSKINDWRYAKTESGITTTLFLGKFMFGSIQPSDDIAELAWLSSDDITVDNIMDEHQELFIVLKNYLEDNLIWALNVEFANKVEITDKI